MFNISTNFTFNLHFFRSKSMTKNHVLQAFLMAASSSLDTSESIQVIDFMERHVLRLASAKGFEAVITTNTNQLTQQIDETLLGYKTLKEFQINRYVDKYGERPFEEAQDWQKTTTMWKDISGQLENAYDLK